MPNAKDTTLSPKQKILALGHTGSGKTSQIWTLPGKKFAYIFDPAALLTLQGLDIDYEEFLPEALEMDATLKGFNKGSKSDRPATKKEPTTYVRWVEDLNEKASNGFFDNYDWLIFDSLTLLASAVFDRQLFINNRYGSIEDLADYRVVGSKLSEVFRSITSLPINIYCTGHINTFQDEKTKKINAQINLPGKSRTTLPLMFSNIWLLSMNKEGKYVLQTKPEARGFKDIRTSIKNLKDIEDITIKEWKHPEKYGIGAILTKDRRQNSPS